MHARRAILYMPGDDMHKIRKATTLGVDSICMDMEDGVALNRKAQARSTISSALKNLDFGHSERLVRINAVGTGLEAEDLASVLTDKPDGIVIPKVQDADQIRWVSRKIGKIENESGWNPGSIVLLVVVETARGVINLKEIAGSDSRLQALIFGAEDFSSDIGATRTIAGSEVFYARSTLVAHAGAFGLQAIDMIYINFHDTEGLKNEALKGAVMGFSGKQIIHPAQVTPTQESFTPSEEEIQKASQLLDSFYLHQEAGRGVFALNGKLIEAPMIKSAERILERARAAGKY
jgi:citrate lyase beta subunit